jgi:hypothetical protein
MKLFAFFGIWSIALTLACNPASPEHVNADAQCVDIDASEPCGVCRVHNLPLIDGVVEVTYGLIRRTEEENDALQKLFPYARSELHGGCVVEKEKRARVSYCPECRKAEAVWKENYNQNYVRAVSNLEQVRKLLKSDPRFGAVDAGLYLEFNNSLGLEGSVKTDTDLADLRRIVEATKPPKPVHWKVHVSTKES